MKFSIKALFNDLVSMGAGKIGLLDVPQKENLRWNNSTHQLVEDPNQAHTSYLERARKAREDSGLKIGKIFNHAVMFGKIALSQLNTSPVAQEGMRLKNGDRTGGFERNPADDSVYKNYAQRVREEYAKNKGPQNSGPK